MRRLFSCLTSLVLIILFGWFLWSQRAAFEDFFNALMRQASAPPSVSYEETKKDEGEEEAAGNSSLEIGDDSSAGQNKEDTQNNQANLNSSDLEDNSDGRPLSPESPSTPLTPFNPSVPSEYNLAVPFTSQAPTANWDAVHEETCEEAALYMVHEFYEGVPAGQISATTAEADIMKIVEFEKALFGFFESTTATQIAILAEQMYGYEKVEVIIDPTIDDLKEQILAGHPVIVPAAGRLLGNPNFSGEGPLYHALVLKGYTETTFVTNDPGTRRGSDYQYDFATVMNAIHDWNGGDVLNGAKVVVVVYPNE